MCTTTAKKINGNWILGKARDPVLWMRYEDECRLFATPQDTYKKLIIQNPIPHEDGYYGGINECGVAFVSTFVRTSHDQVSYIRKPYVRLILDAASARQAVEIIKSFNPKIGGNMLVADPGECFGIEATAKEYYVEEVKEECVKTNHFLHLSDRNLNFDVDITFEPWTKAHLARAEELLPGVNSIEDMCELFKDRVNSNKKCAISTTPSEAKCYTHSAFVFDCQSKMIYYAQGCPSEVDWKRYDFYNAPNAVTHEQID
ncbi:MAG: carcinine hydrolase/isopenicillin-N N-acyltransferase family protein [Deltaproteobacteria bacterium]